ncbi:MULTISPECIES: hypothetical protein [unclassified Streptomyces]|uniref:hypothetical protein n=1 Tax=unclassified Streptomyces TaxID=2593676 RepID=UPI0011CDC1DE|nr:MULTISPECIES: hypothetical protein [unclassified Streptomyces]TXS72847.1 hypothetical protein EAO69_16670 [Streptomyces sp. me109]
MDDLDDLDRRLPCASGACGTDPRVAAAARALSPCEERAAPGPAAGLTGAAAAVCVSGPVVGVHHPAGALGGVALGALTARAGVRCAEAGHG